MQNPFLRSDNFKDAFFACSFNLWIAMGKLFDSWRAAIASLLHTLTFGVFRKSQPEDPSNHEQPAQVCQGCRGTPLLNCTQ